MAKHTDIAEPDYLAELLTWAEWGKTCFRLQLSPADWSAVETLIEAARFQLLEDSKALRALLEHSADQLKSADPFLCDLGVHRWLANDNEPSYSDWLAWVLEKLGDPSTVLHLLGICDPEFISSCSGQYYRVEREMGVKEGYSGCPGRIDIAVHFGEPEIALIGVEVKTSDESYEKQHGYLTSLQCSAARVECVLVTNKDVPQSRLFGFKLRKWEHVAVALRQAVARSVEKGGTNVILVMMLAFVAAIEQSLLGYRAAAPRRAWDGLPTLCPTDLFDHLKTAIEVQRT